MAGPVRVSELNESLDEAAQPPKKRLRPESFDGTSSRWPRQQLAPEHASSSTLWGEQPDNPKLGTVLRSRQPPGSANHPDASTSSALPPARLMPRSSLRVRPPPPSADDPTLLTPPPPPPPTLPPAWFFNTATSGPPAAPPQPPHQPHDQHSARATLYARLQARRDARRQMRAEEVQQESSRMRAVQHTIDHLEQLEAAWEATRMRESRLTRRMTALRSGTNAAADGAPTSPSAWSNLARVDAPAAPATAGGLRPATPPAHADATPSGRWASRAGDRLADAFLSLLQAIPDVQGVAYAEFEREERSMFTPWAQPAGMLGQLGSHGLPLQLLLTDRDFDEHDYELLLALDETIENRKGATAEAIAALPIKILDEEQLANCSEHRCPICLEAHVVGAELRQLPCGHAYHKGCVDTWLHHKSTCPVCTRDICQAGHTAQ